MARLCLKCIKGWLDQLEVGDVVVKEEDCSNCYGDSELQKTN